MTIINHRCQQLRRLKANLDRKRLSLVNRKGLILRHDYPFFKGLRNHFDGLRLALIEDVEHDLISYFTSKPK